MERIYTIPLVDAYNGLRTKRARRAIKFIKLYASKHMKVDLANVKMSEGVNSLVWVHGIQKPPRKVKVKMIKEKEDDIETVKVLLLDETWKVVKINYPEEEKSEKPKTTEKDKGNKDDDGKKEPVKKKDDNKKPEITSKTTDKESKDKEKDISKELSNSDTEKQDVKENESPSKG